MNGEFALIERIKKMIPVSKNPDLIVGIGDDTAVIKAASDRYQLATCDIQIEGTHFRSDWMTPEQIGQRAMTVNLSDIAAMGGTPEFALVSLAIPSGTSEKLIDSIYRGISAGAEKYGVAIIGGNVARIDGPLCIDITLLGSVHPDELVLRSGAKPGDRLFVTGIPGMAAAGFRFLEKYGSALPEASEACIEAFCSPIARIVFGRALAEGKLVHAMIDTSDGLAADLLHLCDASNVGCELHLTSLPVSTELSAAAKELGRSIEELQLRGGESYELLFAVPESINSKQIGETARRHGVLCTEIGIVTEKDSERFIIADDGERRELTAAGWDHFSS